MRRQPYKLNVLLTVDTELTPALGVSDDKKLQANVGSSIYGTPKGEYGIPFQLNCLREHNLKGVFFVEALSPIATGMEPLQEVVDLFRATDHEVQLHIHTEWLAKAKCNPLGQRTGQHLHQFSLVEQTRLIELAKSNLMDCGVGQVSAFRAGNYGANNDTLRALAANGIYLDSSYNYTYLDRSCRIDSGEWMMQPRLMDGVWEIPVTFFSDRPGRYRHAQLAAASFTELSRALLQAHAAGMQTFVIVSHSFELMNMARTRANRILVSRFRKLCRFLDTHRHLFTTVGFDDLAPRESRTFEPLTSPLWATAGRYAEQLAGRIY